EVADRGDFDEGFRVDVARGRGGQRGTGGGDVPDDFSLVDGFLEGVARGEFEGERAGKRRALDLAAEGVAPDEQAASRPEAERGGVILDGSGVDNRIER